MNLLNIKIYNSLIFLFTPATANINSALHHCGFITNNEVNQGFVDFRASFHGRIKIAVEGLVQEQTLQIWNSIPIPVKYDIFDIVVLTLYNSEHLFSESINPETGESEIYVEYTALLNFLTNNLLFDNVNLSKIPLEAIKVLAPTMISIKNTGADSAMLQELSQIPTLKFIQAENNSVERLPDFSQFEKLTVVRLGSNPISISSYNEIKTNGKIKLLGLYNTHIDFKRYGIKLLRTFGQNVAFFDNYGLYRDFINPKRSNKCLVQNDEPIPEGKISWKSSGFIPNVMSNLDFFRFRSRYCRNMKRNVGRMLVNHTKIKLREKLMNITNSTWITTDVIVDLLLVDYYNKYYVPYWQKQHGMSQVINQECDQAINQECDQVINQEDSNSSQIDSTTSQHSSSNQNDFTNLEIPPVNPALNSSPQPEIDYESMIEKDIEELDFTVNIQGLFLDNIKITRVPVDLLNILNVQVLYMMNTGISDGDVEETLKGLPGLQKLFIEHNENIRHFPNICLSPNLTEVSLEGNKLDFSVIYDFEVSRQITSLNLEGVEGALDHFNKLLKISASVNFSTDCKAVIDKNGWIMCSL